MGMVCQRHAPSALPPRLTRYPLCRRLDDPHDLSGRVRKTPPPPCFDPGTLQPVTNCYTDYKIPAVDCNRKPHEFRHQHYSFLGLPKRFYFYESRVGTYPANPYLRNATAVEVWGIDCACRMKCTRLEHRKVMRLKRLRTSYLLRGLRDVQEKPVRRISIMLK